MKLTFVLFSCYCYYMYCYSTMGKRKKERNNC